MVGTGDGRAVGATDGDWEGIAEGDGEGWGEGVPVGCPVGEAEGVGLWPLEPASGVGVGRTGPVGDGVTRPGTGDAVAPAPVAGDAVGTGNPPLTVTFRHPEMPSARSAASAPFGRRLRLQGAGPCTLHGPIRALKCVLAVVKCGVKVCAEGASPARHARFSRVGAPHRPAMVRDAKDRGVGAATPDEAVTSRSGHRLDWRSHPRRCLHHHRIP